MTPKTAKAFFERLHREIERDGVRLGQPVKHVAFESDMVGVGRFRVSFDREVA